MYEPRRRTRRKEHEPQLHAEGMATCERLARALVTLRNRAGLTQTQLARRAGWKCQFVCRLEASSGRLPDLTSLVRYAKACGVDIGILFATPDAQQVRPVSALTLQSARHLRLFESLSGQTLIPLPDPHARPSPTPDHQHDAK